MHLSAKQRLTDRETSLWFPKGKGGVRIKLGSQVPDIHYYT